MVGPKDTLTQLMEIEGCLGACIVDSNSGMMLEWAGGAELNLEVAAAGNTEVLQAERRTLRALNQTAEPIQEILVSLASTYHLLRPLTSNRELFIYVVLSRAKSNLGLAMIQVSQIERALAL